jgi:hypothetical protein
MAQAPPHADQTHGGSLASLGKRQKSKLLEMTPLTPFFFGATAHAALQG